MIVIKHRKREPFVNIVVWYWKHACVLVPIVEREIPVNAVCMTPLQVDNRFIEWIINH